MILEMGEGGPSDDGRRQRLLSHSLPRILVGRHQNLPHLLVLLVDLGVGKKKGRGRRGKERKKKRRGGRKGEEEERERKKKGRGSRRGGEEERERKKKGRGGRRGKEGQ